MRSRLFIGLAFAGSVAAQTPSGPGWTKLSESVDAAAFGFQAGTYDASRRVIWYADPTTSIGRMWRFDLATNQWSKIEDPAFVNQGTRHNCSLAYDPINDRIWISECAPSGTTVGTSNGKGASARASSSGTSRGSGAGGRSAPGGNGRSKRAAGSRSRRGSCGLPGPTA